MAPYLFWELMMLVVGVWLMVIVFVIYGWLLLKRQKKMFAQILGTVKIPEKTETELEKSAPVRFEISKDEPIAKYENFVPEEGVDVSFVDKNE